ncbi:methyltransferase domain-containing protein [Streptomyces ochraceiscleroticus]|uniref:Protein-L-isoaspartate O-methyltransferase n=1 Tax=Streptomyces ochraceiscleroticus TaxID=47761 RepID=A0ABW1MEE2_9ACTN|nr:methyltransferase domain-containing protein [Streptomyces ochraceiscleroticus]
MSGSGTEPRSDPYAVEAAAARAGLVRLITMGGGLTDTRWRAAFAEVPRHLFVPVYYVGVAGGYERRAADHPDPERRDEWLRGAYADSALATYVRHGELVSSSSQPSLMAEMLAALRVEDGDEVLEIGAGTGYNAALLAHRLGDERVTTVDLDEEITGPAREHLAAAGYRPLVVTGDGALGCPERAPFDRIMATCQLPSVPPAWVAQCRTGGLILTPLATGLVLLRVTGEGRAEGRFLSTPAYFVRLRSAAPEGESDTEAGPASEERAEVWAATAELPREALRDERFHFLRTLSAGTLDPRGAYELWRAKRRPHRSRFGVTVDGDRQWAWLDAPDGPHRWPLPARD